LFLHPCSWIQKRLLRFFFARADTQEHDTLLTIVFRSLAQRPLRKATSRTARDPGKAMSAPAAAHGRASGKPVLLGIFVTAAMTKRRALIRRTIFRSFDSLPPGAVDARFVVGAGAGVTVLAEQAAHGDLLLLNGTRENKESGKNLDYFLLVAERMPRRYSWVVKADADSYVVVANLWRELSLLEPADGYFGAHWPWPTLRRRVAPLLPNGTTRGTKAVVSPAALLAARAALAAFSGFVDDGGAAAPEWAFCGPLYALSGDVVRWLGGALGRGASSAAEWLRPPTSLPRGLPFGEDMQAPPTLAPHHAHVASPRLASPRPRLASPHSLPPRLASPGARLPAPRPARQQRVRLRLALLALPLDARPLHHARALRRRLAPCRAVPRGRLPALGAAMGPADHLRALAQGRRAAPGRARLLCRLRRLDRGGGRARRPSGEDEAATGG